MDNIDGRASTRALGLGICCIAVAASVAGGAFGYLIGAYAFDTIGKPILDSLGKAGSIAEFNTKFNAYGLWAVLIAGVTPFPFKVITIMSGWTSMPFGVFLVSAIIARSLRFFAVAALLYFFGSPIRNFIERRLGLVFTLFLAILIIGLFAVKLM